METKVDVPVKMVMQFRMDVVWQRQSQAMLSGHLGRSGGEKYKRASHGVLTT